MGNATQAIVDVVAVVASVEFGPELGAQILGYDSVAAAEAAGYTADTISAVGTAATTAGTSAASTAAQGGDASQILKSAGIGAVSGAVGSEIGGAVGSETGSTAAGAAAKGFSSGFTSGELSGENLQQSTKQGLISGAASGLTSELFPTDSTSSTGEKIASGLAGSGISNLLSGYFNPATSPITSGSSSTAPLSVATTGQAGTAPGSQALAQALNVGGGFDSTSPIQLGGEPSTSRSVWNQASLRSMDETGGA